MRRCLLFFMFLFLSAACTGSPSTAPPDAAQVQSGFSHFLQQVLHEELACDTLSLHYYLAYPEAYGLSCNAETAGFGTHSVTGMQESAQYAASLLETLSTYEYIYLTEEQQLLYDILAARLPTIVAMGEFSLLTECLGPVTGLQAQLPILLSEYTFYTREDVRCYLALLASLPAYFEQICAFEREKAACGLFMSDAVADRILAQCSAFIASPEKNMLIETFDERLLSYNEVSRRSGETKLSTDEQILLAEENRGAVLTYVIPAYEQLIACIQTLRGTGVNPLGYCGFENGSAYYQLLAQNITGSDKTVPQMKAAITDMLRSCIDEMMHLEAAVPDIAAQAAEHTAFPDTPEEILTHLQTVIQEDFPSAPAVSCRLEVIHPSLQSYLSPAMYLIPPLDTYTDNTIYINTGPEYAGTQLLPVLAHEGYPGHLYQNAYLRSQEPHPLRLLLRVTGYDEGWATYAESLSYAYGGANDAVADYLTCHLISSHCLYSLTDIGIHYESWTEQNTATFWAGYGIGKETAYNIHLTMLAEPAVYLPYCVGYIELLDLLEQVKSAKGNDFTLLEFHTRYLQLGSVPFSVACKWLQ